MKFYTHKTTSIFVIDVKFHKKPLFRLRDVQFFQTAVTNLSSSNVCNKCRLVCVKILFKSEQICGFCCKMLRGSLFWDTLYMYSSNTCCFSSFCLCINVVIVIFSRATSFCALSFRSASCSETSEFSNSSLVFRKSVTKPRSSAYCEDSAWLISSQ